MSRIDVISPNIWGKSWDKGAHRSKSMKRNKKKKKGERNTSARYLSYGGIIFVACCVALGIRTEYLYVLDRFDVEKLTYGVIEIHMHRMRLAATRWRVHKICRAIDRSQVAAYFYSDRIYIFNVHAIFMSAWYSLYIFAALRSPPRGRGVCCTEITCVINNMAL